MAYIHGFTNPANILKDLATALTTGDTLKPENNWRIVYPSSVDQITNKVIFKVQPVTTTLWVKKEPHVVENGKITLNNNIAGNIRVYVVDKKYYLYWNKHSSTPDVSEFVVSGARELTVHIALNGKQVLVDYEKPVNIVHEYYVKLEKPETRSDGKPNNHFITWVIGENYDPTTDTFPEDHYSESGKLSWFKENPECDIFVKEWLPIEYWISFDRNAAVGVVMGDPGLSPQNYLSSPFYFGSLRQIDGALETDLVGNFAAFSGSATEPTFSKRYGDYTGTGIIDVVMVATKTGRPYQAHKVQIFTGYEFREKTFNGQSLHTGKHAVSEIVLADVHENDRGILRHCLAVPRVAKEHGTELIYNRYISGEEETYIYLNINAPFTPINTSPDVLVGLAIRTDI